MLVIDDVHSLGKELDAFANWFDQQPEFKGVTVGMDVPDQLGYEDFIKRRELKTKFHILIKIDEAYIPTLGMELLAGRNFTSNPGDASKIILNEGGFKNL